ncbi:uncharacterized protein M421DRAFT_94797 [Didymella exigua CBS 183.55]|uniref:Uncharacterized protein n=1 Tax=Didymella exigua CBS 183.55 TaxID=1150837 RepID=A0A6A5RFS0_9PLEO|nr:uncharacterized protein M421DRAFT_94797 [Didymella exigua CBS 183.55]KAF1925346.1 hypothetical protein M421DRAFT_94797 [Didymella exigua CBS 183.55]
MVAFSRITFAIAVAGLSSAQSFSGPAPSGFPTDLPTDFPSGAARPTGGFGGGPRPSGTGVVGAQRAQQSGNAPFPSGGDFSGFPSGAARPTGHHSPGGKGMPSGKPSGAVPTDFPSAASDLERRQQPTGLPGSSGSSPGSSGSSPGSSGSSPGSSGSSPGSSGSSSDSSGSSPGSSGSSPDSSGSSPGTPPLLALVRLARLHPALLLLVPLLLLISTLPLNLVYLQALVPLVLAHLACPAVPFLREFALQDLLPPVCPAALRLLASSPPPSVAHRLPLKHSVLGTRSLLTSADKTGSRLIKHSIELKVLVLFAFY